MATSSLFDAESAAVSADKITYRQPLYEAHRPRTWADVCESVATLIHRENSGYYDHE